MKKSKKVWLGVATIWPICWIFIFMAAMLAFVLYLPVKGSGPEVPGAFPFIVTLFFLLHLLTGLGSLAMTVYYIFNIFRNERLEQNHKIMWTLLMFFMGMLAQPVYWYLYIWRAPDEETGPAVFSRHGQLNQARTENWTSGAGAYGREREYVPPPQGPPDWR